MGANEKDEGSSAETWMLGASLPRPIAATTGAKTCIRSYKPALAAPMPKPGNPLHRTCTIILENDAPVHSGRGERQWKKRKQAQAHIVSVRFWVRPPHSNSGKLLSLYIAPQKKHNCLEASGVPSFGRAQALDSRIWHLEFPDIGGPN